MKVHVSSNDNFEGCTDTKVTVRQGQSKSIELVELHDDGSGRCGKYNHEAMGTVGGKYDVKGREDSSVTCRKDWLGVCQCTKD